MAKIQIQDLEPQSFISEVDANELENVQGGSWLSFFGMFLNALEVAGNISEAVETSGSSGNKPSSNSSQQSSYREGFEQATGYSQWLKRYYC